MGYLELLDILGKHTASNFINPDPKSLMGLKSKYTGRKVLKINGVTALA